MYQRRDDVLEHHPVGDPPAMAVQRVSRVKLRALVTEQNAELAPDRLQQA
jgi:hypothetical protein